MHASRNFQFLTHPAGSRSKKPALQGERVSLPAGCSAPKLSTRTPRHGCLPGLAAPALALPGESDSNQKASEP
jgi:hypothetical protein